MPGLALILTVALASSAPPSSTTETSSAAASGAGEHRMRIVLLDLRTTPKLSALAHRTTDKMLLHLGKRKGVTAVGEAEIRLLVTHYQEKNELTMCESEQCLEDISRATDADKLISGHLGPWGEGYLVTLSLVDVDHKTVERGESAMGESENDLFAALGPALDRLLGVSEGGAEQRFAVGAQGAKIAVLDLASYGVEQALADNLTQLLALELKKIEGLSVISREEIKAMLEYEAQKQIAQCKSDVSCLIEIGGALGVQFLVSGGIGKLEDTYVISLKLMDVSKAEVVSRVSETYRGPERHLNQSLRFATWELLNRPITGKGDVAISTEVESARSKVDGGQPIAIPTRIDALSAGKHTLATSADGFHASFQEFYIEPDTTTKVRPDLIELPAPWYNKWWTWAIIGSAVAGAVTASVLIATATPDNGGVDILLHR